MFDALWALCRDVLMEEEAQLLGSVGSREAERASTDSRKRRLRKAQEDFLGISTWKSF